jgi:hypothetical protein
MERSVSVGEPYVSKGEDGIWGDVMPVTLACGHVKRMGFPLHIPAGTRLRCYACEDAARTPVVTPKHTARDCDETCHCCPQCYLESGKDNECDRLCEHAEVR